MAATLSTMLPLGTIAPAFTLPDTVTGRTMSLDELASAKATVVLFLCNHCPYVKHINDALVDLAGEYIPRDVSFIAISANDAERYPEDAPARMREVAAEVGYQFPYLYDESQEVARAYHAVCTPDIYLFDGDRRLVYRGQFDETRPSSGARATGRDLRAALDELLAGRAPSEEQTPSIGCGIKWRE